MPAVSSIRPTGFARSPTPLVLAPRTERTSRFSLVPTVARARPSPRALLSSPTTDPPASPVLLTRPQHPPGPARDSPESQRRVLRRPTALIKAHWSRCPRPNPSSLPATAQARSRRDAGLDSAPRSPWGPSGRGAALPAASARRSGTQAQRGSTGQLLGSYAPRKRRTRRGTGAGAELGRRRKGASRARRCARPGVLVTPAPKSFPSHESRRLAGVSSIKRHLGYWRSDAQGRSRASGARGL